MPYRKIAGFYVPYRLFVSRQNADKSIALQPEV